MKVGRSFFVHVGLLCASVVFAVGVWTRDKQPKALVESNVVVWQGRAGDISRIAYEGKTKKVQLEAQKDSEGMFFIGSVDKEITVAKKAPDGGEAGDAGVEDGGASGSDTAEPVKERSVTAFVSVGGAQKLLEQLAPLKALRGIGRLTDEKAAEFGFKEPEGTLSVQMGGAERKLVFGAATPGGGDRYAKDPATGEVYALKGDIFRSLDNAESNLIERNLHEWTEADVGAATITSQGKTRKLLRGGPEGKRFWADPGTADTNDETAGNWMSKLDRLRPAEYVQGGKEEGRDVVVRVDYENGAGKKIGYVELLKTQPAANGKPDYLIVSERTRLTAKVTAQTAEQVEQDVGSLMK